MGLAKRLNGEYLETYNEIMIELDVEEINFLQQEEVKNDILDMLLSAQEDKVAVKEIVGNDRSEFIKEVLESLDNGHEKLFRIGRYLSMLMTGIGGVALTRVKSGVLEFTVDILFLAIVFIIGEKLGRIISKKDKSGKERRKKKRKIEWSFNIGMIVISAFVVRFFNIDLPVLFVISSPYIFVIASLIIGFITMVITDIALR